MNKCSGVHEAADRMNYSSETSRADLQVHLLLPGERGRRAGSFITNGTPELARGAAFIMTAAVTLR